MDGIRAKDQTKRWPETQRCADEGSGTDGCLPRGHPAWDGDWDGDYATSDFPKGDILMYQVLDAYADASCFFFAFFHFLTLVGEFRMPMCPMLIISSC